MLVFAVDKSSTLDVVVANCEADIVDVTFILSEDAIFPEVNAVFEEVRGLGDVSLVVTSSRDVPAKRVVTSEEVVTFDGVVEITPSVGIIVDRTVLCVLEVFGLCS